MAEILRAALAKGLWARVDDPEAMTSGGVRGLSKALVEDGGSEDTEGMVEDNGDDEPGAGM